MTNAARITTAVTSWVETVVIDPNMALSRLVVEPPGAMLMIMTPPARPP